MDDDIELASLMSAFFAEHGFALHSEPDAVRGLARALEGRFELILLDVMMPGLDGFELLHQLRRRSSVPVIMLTARTEQAARIAGLNAGADDYLPKPFGPEELLARIRAVLRRSGRSDVVKPAILQVGGIRLNPGSREVWRGKTRIEITSVEFDILNMLMRSAGRIVSRNELAAILYQRGASPYERSIDVHVSHLRKKLEQDDRGLIRTVRGVGYLFRSDSQ
ncbi:MAG TPA: response regulator transcription factor [Bryobacteraceae bacterium]|nr:response regulator transcription factor [Bryobacteraceae bacterium]